MQAIPPTTSSFSIGTVPVAIYTRVSTHRQVGGRFDSCESQAAICRDFLHRHVNEGWFEVMCYTDPAYSGSNMARPGIQALKRAIEVGAIKVVLIYKLERLLRSTDEWGPFRTFLKKHGCALVSTSEGICGHTPSEQFRNNVLVSVAEYERLNTIEKIRAKMLELAKRGIWNCGQIPYGYCYDTKKRMLEPCPIESPIVRRIYDDAARLVSVPDIVDDLNDQGIRTRLRKVHNREGMPRTVGGRSFRDDLIRNMIRNPIYAGRIRFQKLEFPGLHIPLVDATQWERANASIQQLPAPSRQSRKRDKHFHLLKGLVHCGSCGRPMMPNSSGCRSSSGKPYRYYACGYNKEPQTPTCTVRHVSADVLEAVVVRFIEMCAHHPEVLEGAAKARAEYPLGGREAVQRRIEQTRNSITVINEQIENCIRAISGGHYTLVADELRERIQGLKYAKPELLIQHEQLRQELLRYDSRAIDINAIRQSMDRLQELLPKLPRDDQKCLVALMFDRIEVNPAPSMAPAKSSRREFQLKFHIRLTRLVEGMANWLVVRPPRDRDPRRGRVMVMKLNFELSPAGTRAPVVILTPWRHEIIPLIRRPDAAVTRQKQLQNPMLRALEWQRMMAADSSLSFSGLAKRVKVTPGTITHHFKLLQLQPEIQLFLANLKTAPDLRRFSLNRMKALAGLPSNQQLARYHELSNQSVAHIVSN